MSLFYKKMDEPPYKIKTVGPFSGSVPDAESTLDIQFGGAIARGAQQWFWVGASGAVYVSHPSSRGLQVDNTWMLSFAQALMATRDAPLVVSMSWGWPESGQCVRFCASAMTCPLFLTCLLV